MLRTAPYPRAGAALERRADSIVECHDPRDGDPAPSVLDLSQGISSDQDVDFRRTISSGCHDTPHRSAPDFACRQMWFVGSDTRN